MDWPKTSEDWNLAFNGVNAVSVLAATIVAATTIRSWRSEQRSARQIDIAGEALRLALEARDAVTAVRHWFGNSEEGSTRKKLPGETEELARKLDDAYAPIERIERYSDLFARMQACRYKLRAEFGDEWRDAFGPAFKFRTRLFAAAGGVMRMYRREAGGQRLPQGADRYLQELERLRFVEDETDDTTVEIDGMVKRMDGLADDVRGEGKRSWAYSIVSVVAAVLCIAYASYVAMALLRRTLVTSGQQLLMSTTLILLLLWVSVTLLTRVWSRQRSSKADSSTRSATANPAS
ncbi:MAG TPA: hypothetical protein VH518_15715 [Tepidisphaeraceae bacterium]|jgi:hypothetical protein